MVLFTRFFHYYSSCSIISCYSSLPHLNVCCGVKVKCCSPCASGGPDTVPKSPIQPSQWHIWTKLIFENDLKCSKTYKKKKIAFDSASTLSFGYIFEYLVHVQQLLCPDRVKLVHSWYTWLHQRAGHFNTPSPAFCVFVLMLIKPVLHSMSVWKHWADLALVIQSSVDPVTDWHFV